MIDENEYINNHNKLSNYLLQISMKNKKSLDDNIINLLLKYYDSKCYPSPISIKINKDLLIQNLENIFLNNGCKDIGKSIIINRNIFVLLLKTKYWRYILHLFIIKLNNKNMLPKYCDIGDECKLFFSGACYLRHI